MDRIALIQLGRLGDLCSIAPICKAMHDAGDSATVFVMDEFANFFDGVSYAQPHPVHTDFRDVRGQREAAKLLGFDKIIATQTPNNDTKVPVVCDNYQVEGWVRAGYIEQFHELPLIFDQRDRQREQESIDKYVPKDDGRPLLVYNLSGMSGAYPNNCRNDPKALEQQKWIVEIFSRTHRLLDLGPLKLPRVYDMLGIFELADVLISIDTVTLHLAYATLTPTVAYTNHRKGSMSEPRMHWIEHMDYPASMTKEGRIRTYKAVFGSKEFGKFVREPWQMASCTMFMAADFEIRQGEVCAIERQCEDAAIQSWQTLSDYGSFIKVLLRDRGRMQRTSHSEFGDPRRLCFIKDLIGVALEDMDSLNGIILLCHAQTCLTKRVAESIRRAMIGHECRFARGEEESRVPRVFAFTRDWWDRHKDTFPDVLKDEDSTSILLADLMLADDPGSKI